ncbi:hypothetical protein B0T10DRAFT_467191 [Thelonectria olida]|uniref:Myb-like domain-containing protein n=1 Tax=Thelonectria olida TaxID=1576542 RepID=A0A9P9AJU4_9HYPO|nr:hypothetical protein B0T10DRAFT_467191 [Thelonectria olida]
MNRPLEITQWHPSQLQQKSRPSATTRIREPRSSISDASAQSIAPRGETSSPIIVGVEDSTNADPYAGFSSIEEISAEAMRPAPDNSIGVGIGTPDPVALSDLDKNGRVCSLQSRVNSAIANEADDGSRKMSLTQTASSTALFFTSLCEGEDAFVSTSPGGAFGKPILIPSDVDSDTERSGDDQASNDSDSSLPPPRKLRISATRSRMRRSNCTSSPVKRMDNYNGTHSEKPTLLDGIAPCVADVVIEPPKTVPHCAADALTPAHELPEPILWHLGSNGVPCESDDVPTSSTLTNHDAVPETPHERPVHLPLESSEGQALEKVDSTKPGAVANNAIRAATPTSSSRSASDCSTSARMPQLPIASLEMVEVPRNTGDVPLSTTPSRCSSTSTTCDASPANRVFPQTPPSGPATTDCGPSDVEAQAQKTASASPSLGPVIHRRSRRQAASKLIRYDDDSDSDADGNSQRSEGDRINSQNDDNYRLSALTDEEEDQEGENKDEQFPRKRRRISKSSTGRASLRSTTRSARWGNRPREGGIPSPALSQSTSTEAEVGAVLATFEEWPLKNVSLKRIIENGRATFQLQFDWSPCIERGHTGSTKRGCVDSPSTRTVGKAKRSSATRVRYTTPEDKLLLKLKEDEKLTWPKIHQRFCETYPGRSVESLQVHYSTKLESRERS